ncbi:MAG: uroporphyrinogen decarboxylase family protein [Bacillota bacterium]
MAAGLTARQRVAAALNHEEPDRVPVDFASTHNTGISIIAYNRLKRHCGITSPSYMRDPIPMLASPDLEGGHEIIKLLGSDFLPLPRHINSGMRAENWRQWVLKDGSTCMVPGDFNPVETEAGYIEFSSFNGMALFRMPKGGYYFDSIRHPLNFVENLSQLEEVTALLYRSGIFHIDQAELIILKEQARRIHEETDYAVVASGGPMFFSLYQIGQELFGYEKFFMFMASEPDLIRCWMDFLARTCAEKLRHYLRELGPYIDVIMMGDDYGTQEGLQLSPRMFRELFKPHLAAVCRLVHEISPRVKILLHSCGSIAPLIPDFIEVGIDALNPVQITAKNMDPVTLKREFGKEITFWGGGVRTQTTLVNGTQQEVINEVKEMLEIFKPGGGYIFCPIHDIQEHVPPATIVAIYEAARQYGAYNLADLPFS